MLRGSFTHHLIANAISKNVAFFKILGGTIFDLIE